MPPSCNPSNTRFSYSSWLLGLVVSFSNGLPARIPTELSALVGTDLRDKDWKSSLRGNVCHNMIYTGRGLGATTDCFPTGERTVLLWGDSHAAALYSGVAALQDEYGFKVWQATTDATAPLFSSDIFNNMRRSLESVNTRVLEQIWRDPPDVVLLHAFWLGYGFSDPVQLTVNLKKTVAMIQEAAVDTRVVVLGPVPIWRASLQQNLLNYYSRHRATLPGNYMRFGLVNDVTAFDAALARGIESLGVEYISAVDELCNEDGCLAYLTPTTKGVAYVDGQHLSTSAAKYLAGRIMPRVLH